MRIFLLITILSLLNSPIILSSPQSILLPRGSPLPSCPTPDPTLNYRPVIGILTHPGDGASGRIDNRTGVTNIPASYVKFVESAGARVVPLIHTDPWETILDVRILFHFSLFFKIFFLPPSVESTNFVCDFSSCWVLAWKASNLQ